VARPQKNALEEVKRLESNLSFDEEMAKDEWEHRKAISSEIISAFKVINFVIVGLVAIFFVVDIIVTLNRPEYAPFKTVDAKTLMTLIGATTVQLGAIALGVSNWLFPKRKR
jgi:hypothetical protein